VNISRLDLIADLQDRVNAVIGNYLAEKPFALVDFPNIRNVGDSAIWLGEMAYFSRLGYAPTYVSEMSDYSATALRGAVPDGPIFIHGGGNFGDIWEAHQDFRERIIEEWPDRQIIQLPQSIHYGSMARVEKTARVIGRHKNFVLLVRDQESLSFAKKHFDCDVYLCPDMALCIGPIRPNAARFPILAMLRADKEKSGDYNLSAYPGLPVEDWITESARSIQMVKLRNRLTSLGKDTQSARLAKFNSLAQTRFTRGVTQISRGRAIVTDRLHVHIVSLLLGRPHATLDNSYGKIGRFMAAFTGDNGLSYRTKSFDDAMRWAMDEGQRLADQNAVDGE